MSGLRIKHETHTTAHGDKCVIAARALAQAADQALEAGQYSWTGVARPTLQGALEQLERARTYLTEAMVLVGKQEVAVEAPPAPVASSPGQWPVASS